MVCFYKSQYTCTESNLEHYRELIKKYFPCANITEKYDEESKNTVLLLDLSVQGSLMHILPLKPTETNLECCEDKLIFFNNFISFNNNNYEMYSTQDSKLSFSKDDLECALIKHPSITRYYFLDNNVCIFATELREFIISIKENEPTTFTNADVFIIFDIDDGFLFWTFDGFRPNTFEKLNNSFKNWKENCMTCDILKL